MPTGGLAPNWPVSPPKASAPGSHSSRSGVAWTIQKSPNGPATTDWLNDVTCTGPTSCIAVGGYVNASEQDDLLVETLDGSHWSVEAAPTPAGAVQATFSAVACSAQDACAAVGTYLTSGGAELALAERWNGRSWTLQTVPIPKSSTGAALVDVACPGTAACTAVGVSFSTTKQVTMALEWNGSSWGVVSTPDPASHGLNALDGVSCVSASECVAVGAYGVIAAPYEEPIVATWNGHTWAEGTPALPKTGDVFGLTDVSCTGASWCMAFGDYETTQGAQELLAEEWNGKSWTLTDEPMPAAAESDLPRFGVSCASSEDCVAAGSWINSDTGTEPIAERWNGTSWEIQPTAAGGLVLSDVACPSLQVCEAVGGSSDFTTLAEAWNGSSWASQFTQNLAGAASNGLSAISCTTSCEAVGSYVLPNGTVLPLAESNTSGAWVMQKTGLPSGSSQGELLDVWCAAPASCVAIGLYEVGTSGPFNLVGERWDGTTWSGSAVPAPAGSSGRSLSALSCSSATSCTAVGYFITSAGAQEPLIERWNGTTWSIETGSTVSSADYAVLSSVSCSSGTSCVAVGETNPRSDPEIVDPLVESWNGSKWQLMKGVTPDDAYETFLSSVSCVSATQCVAAGTVESDSLVGTTLIETLHGTAWSVTYSPNVAGQTQNDFNSVSCTSATFCVAAGSTFNGSTRTSALAASWNGSSWTLEDAAEAPGSPESILTSVSCSHTSCEAAGFYRSAIGAAGTLVEER
jgi:hypothetical protein